MMVSLVPRNPPLVAPPAGENGRRSVFLLRGAGFQPAKLHGRLETGPTSQVSQPISVVQNKFPRVDQRPGDVVEQRVAVAGLLPVVVEQLAVLRVGQPPQRRQEQLL